MLKMSSFSFSSRVFTLGFSWLALISLANAFQSDLLPKFFNVMNYGANPDNKTDNSEAFLKAWDEACQWKGKSRLSIPEGNYKLNSVVFKGPCNGQISFVIKGLLRAPINPSEFFFDHWITFQRVDQLVVKGDGTLDGQGSSAWKYNDCTTNSNCPQLPATMRFDFVTNSRIHHLHSIDSKNTHFHLFACENLNMSNIRIISPDESPNTDGIKIGASNNIRIKNSFIGTGDDCVAMVSGSRNIDISNVWCGPGHGFSIGSLGKWSGEDPVTGVTIRNCTLNNTQNGVRIKTWASSIDSLASDFTFKNIFMDNVNNPILIDQQYCPTANCDNSASSMVQIKNVSFSRIWGSSSSEVAIKLDCSKIKPCKGVSFKDIDLHYNQGKALTECFNVMGEAYGNQNPMSCL